MKDKTRKEKKYKSFGSTMFQKYYINQIYGYCQKCGKEILTSKLISIPLNKKETIKVCHDCCEKNQ